MKMFVASTAVMLAMSTATLAQSGADSEVTIYYGALPDMGGAEVSNEEAAEMTVQAPIALASEVCGVEEDILQVWNQASTGYCVAVNSNEELQNLINE